MSVNEDGTLQILEYIHLQGPNPDVPSRKRVRAHVMRDYRRRQASTRQGSITRQPAKMDDRQAKRSRAKSDGLFTNNSLGRKPQGCVDYSTRSYNSPTKSETSSDRTWSQSSETQLGDDQEEDTRIRWPHLAQGLHKDLFDAPWAGQFDPFGVLPVAGTESVHNLLFHCKLMPPSEDLFLLLSLLERRIYCY